MIPVCEEFQPGDFFYDELNIAQEYIRLVMQAYPDYPGRLKAILQSAYSLIGDAREFFD